MRLCRVRQSGSPPEGASSNIGTRGRRTGQCADREAGPQAADNLHSPPFHEQPQVVLVYQQPQQCLRATQRQRRHGLIQHCDTQ